MRAPIFCVAQHCYSRGNHSQSCVDETCTGCLPRRARHPSQLCIHHERRLTDDISNIAQCYNDLAVALIPPDLGMQPKVSGGNYKSNSFPFNDAAAQLRKQIQQTLTQLTTSIALQRNVTPPQYTSVAYLATYLSRHTEYIITSQTLARRASSTLNQLTKHARRVAFPSGTKTIDIGACPHTYTTDPTPSDPHYTTHPCPGTIRAQLRRSDSLLPSELACSHNTAHTWPPRQWLRLRRQLQSSSANEPATDSISA